MGRMTGGNFGIARGALGALLVLLIWGRWRYDVVSFLALMVAVAVVMDTAWCDGAVDLAAGTDLLLCEATFLSTEEDKAVEYGHLTARQAGRLAAEAGVGRLVLSHFSRRYPDVEAFEDEAAEEFDGDIVLARDLDHIDVPRPA